MRLGLPWQGPELAAEAEDAGFSAFCTGDFADHDAYVSLTQMAAGTTRMMIGTAIAYAFARTPYAHATAVRQIHNTAPGRVFLGLGTGAFRINRDWFDVPADRPVARIRDLVGAIRAYLWAENGETIRYEGEFYRVQADIRAPVFGRIDVPILLGAFNARMVAAAGGIADGIIGHGLFTGQWWNEVVRPNLASGARAAGRDPASLREYGWVITAVDDRAPERAILDARRMIAFYLTVRTYDPLVEQHNWEAPVEAIRAAFRRGDPDAMAKAVTDDMLTAVAVCGTTDEARKALSHRRGALPRDLAFLAPPSYLVGHRRRQAYARAALSIADVNDPACPPPDRTAENPRR